MRFIIALALLTACGPSSHLTDRVVDMRLRYLDYILDRQHEIVAEISTSLDEQDKRINPASLVVSAFDSGRRLAIAEDKLLDMSRVLHFTRCIEERTGQRFSPANPFRPELLDGEAARECAEATMGIAPEKMLSKAYERPGVTTDADR